ncbi:DNA polymerase/3'-5' exonuclease PolX [Frateuria defendens]|uniref:DNA polymerase/3'-5' exonuclease PolX n=1 Tax=Frateuria defendens TaxID=2219559 RepID=UPI0009E36B01|nr:DNA polymerase/3'-5' exonuclease PolX [Frateuria defendens]
MADERYPGPKRQRHAFWLAMIALAAVMALETLVVTRLTDSVPYSEFVAALKAGDIAGVVVSDLAKATDIALRQGQVERRYERLILIAPPRFLGALHGQLDHALRGCIAGGNQAGPRQCRRQRDPRAPAATPAAAMSATNVEITAVFDEIADWLEIDEANPFRIRAYRNAARTVSAWPDPLAEWLRTQRPLSELPGIGGDLAAKIEEILRSGSCSLLRQLRRGHPRGLTELLKIPGIGARRAERLYRELGITSPRRLLRAARAGRIHALRGFGVQSERSLLEAATGYLGSERRWKLAVAAQHAEALAAHLRAATAATVEVAGSYRRRRETVGDLDILVAAPARAGVTERFLAYPEVGRVLAHGVTRSAMTLRSGLQVDLRVVPPQSFGAALLYFTGSKAHNLVLRRLAQRRGLKINEYGVFQGKRRVAGDTEQSVYATLGLPWIPPELREDRGEFEAAREGRLPRLIELGDLRGDLHAHTDATDGHADLATMAAAARAAGLAYMAITDHSRHLGVGHGLDAVRLARQIEAIDRFNEQGHGIAVLKGIEVDILEDGRLDLPDAVLARLDLVVAAIHSHFDLPRERQTERILRAMDRPCFSILAHPTGRLIGEREGYQVDLERAMRHAAARGCFLELDAHPDRLDLDDVHCRMAKELGVPLAISSDAHDTGGFAALRFGIGQARRGWIEPQDAINTLPLEQLRRRLAPTMQRPARAP